MKRNLVLALALVALAACSPTFANAPPNRPPAGLGRADAEQLILRADDLRRRAFELPGTSALSEAFGGPALTRLQAQSDSFRLRGLRMEERDSTRSLVYWSSISLEGVLQIAAERRMAPNPQTQRWTETLRQWWVRVARVGDTWLVVDEGELPPDRWRQDTSSA
ncbi:MAG TPA: hypothetical protein VGJ79_14125 [Candidatus Dormibacteraeota bacterium]|jgi:hypothetical protein